MRKFWIIVVLWTVIVVAAPVLASEQASEEHGNKFSLFGKYPGEYIWTLVWFAVLLLVLWRFAWKPLLSGLKARESHIESQIDEADNRVKDADKVLAQYKDKIAGVEAQGRQIIANHTRKAEQKSQEIHQKAMTEAEALRLKAEADIERAQIEAKGDLWVQAGDILEKLGADVLGKAMNDDDNKKLINDAISKFKDEEKN